MLSVVWLKVYVSCITIAYVSAWNTREHLQIAVQPKC